jgi:2-dehydro-3-deoxy-L-rhamnonate dehydrogenase (NAD+)
VQQQAFMERNGYGRIVNITSVAGKEGNPNAVAYNVSKAAVISLTKALGKEVARTEIRVNCIALGAVHTAIFDQMTQEHIDYMLSKIPLGRFGTLEKISVLV